MFKILVSIFDNFLYIPLFNSLVFIYNFLPGHDFGLAIIILTIIIKLVLHPVSVKAIHSQKILSKLQPRIKELQKIYKDDKNKQAKEMLELYRKEKINPFSSLFLALIQLPILIALYRVFWNGLKPEALSLLYDFVPNPGVIGSMFFGFADLAKPNLLLAVLAGVLQFFQTKMIIPENPKSKSEKMDFNTILQKQMLYIFPLITVVILSQLPSALGLYWTTSGLFSIIQQYFILKKYQHDNPGTNK